MKNARADTPPVHTVEKVSAMAEDDHRAGPPARRPLHDRFLDRLLGIPPAGQDPAARGDYRLWQRYLPGLVGPHLPPR